MFGLPITLMDLLPRKNGGLIRKKKKVKKVKSRRKK